MRPHYTLARLYLPQTLTLGDEITLPKEQAHYLATVLRKSEGDAVRVFNGEQGEFRAVLANVSKKSVTLSLDENIRTPQAMPDVWLLFAPIKRARTEFILEKATELGASEIHPVITTRTQFPKLRMERAQSQIIEAAEQTERLDIPALHEAIKLDKFLVNWDEERTLLFADEAGECPPALDVLKTISGSAAILIGPEGGFGDQEREHLRGLPFVRPVSLGPRILRADTAALSLLSLYQAMSGDWAG